MPLSLPPRLERLGGVRLAAAAVSMSIVVPARDLLYIEGHVTGMSAADVIALRFNGDVANNYWHRNLDVAAGVVTVNNTQTPTTAQIAIGRTTSTAARVFGAEITNRLATSKAVTSRVQVSSAVPASAATPGVLVIASGGEWVNTAAQITTVEVRSLGGTATLSADSHFVVFGTNL